MGLIHELDVLHASAPVDQQEVFAFRFNFSTFPGGAVRLVQSMFDMQLTEEDGQQHLFQKCGVGFSLPTISANGKQDLDMQFDGISGDVYPHIKNAVNANRERREALFVTLLVYNSADKNTVRESLPMKVINSSSTAEVVQIRAAYFDINNTIFPRGRYTLDQFGGLEFV